MKVLYYNCNHQATIREDIVGCGARSILDPQNNYNPTDVVLFKDADGVVYVARQVEHVLSDINRAVSQAFRTNQLDLSDYGVVPIEGEFPYTIFTNDGSVCLEAAKEAAAQKMQTTKFKALLYK